MPNLYSRNTEHSLQTATSGLRYTFHITFAPLAYAGEVHALDMGSGTGLFALMAARAGADSVVAAELLPDLCEVARRVCATVSYT